MASMEKRVFRPFIILCVPLLFLACVAAAVCVQVNTHDAILAAPFAIVALGLLRPLRWVMLWLSTSNEREALVCQYPNQRMLR